MKGQELLVGETIRLRAPELEDLPVMYQMENMSELWNVGNVTVPYSRYTLKKYIEQCHNDIFIDRELRLMMELCNSGVVVGTIDLIDYSPLHRRAEVGVAILKPYRRQGIATQAVKLVCEYARRVLCIHQLYAYVAADNQASLELFRCCGFSHEVLLRDWLCEEAIFKNVYLLQKFIFS